MNDSPYGLTASVWTKADSNPDSEQAFLKIVNEIDTGTVFLNKFVTRFMRGWFSHSSQVRRSGSCSCMDWGQEQREGRQPEQVWCVLLRWTFRAATDTAGTRL